jgi:undecaprenyl-diphosphatase
METRLVKPAHFGALLIGGLLLSSLALLESTIHLDEPLLQSVQSALPSQFEGPAWFYNVFLRHTGIPALWAATIVGLLWMKKNDYAALFAVSAFIGLFTTLLKETIDRPRPAGDFAILQFPTDPSYPSGHVMTAMAFFGLWLFMASDLLPRWAVLPARAVCVSTILLTGLSRVWAGAHWPTDVLGGLIWGSVFLALLLMIHPKLAFLRPVEAKPTSR